MKCLPKPCFEVYLNNGAEDGYWDIEMYVACSQNITNSSQGGVLTRRPLFF
ncbi:DNA gyrase inhibitory protein [Escherichia coli]|uniref:DNA gyrase inhibitory protein n=1 Tax=Escherichia coli TaxID=562 RepID=A0A2X1KA73_ECOLX|nr:DNA gyrase inhibitory protein [Escherichia coli]